MCGGCTKELPETAFHADQSYCRDCRGRANHIRSLADKIAGTRAKRFALPRAERDVIWQQAQQLADLGLDIATADRAERSGKKSGFVYVITHPSWPEYVKIGRAFDPESRLASYQTGCPRRGYKLHSSTYFRDAHTAERELHARLEGRRARGEWFYLSPACAAEQIKQLWEVL